MNELEERFDLLKAMYTIVRYINDENACEHWIYEVPDCSTDSDFRGIAEDEEAFGEVVSTFIRLAEKYLRSGLYVGNNLY